MPELFDRLRVTEVRDLLVFESREDEEREATKFRW